MLSDVFMLVMILLVVIFVLGTLDADTGGGGSCIGNWGHAGAE